MITDQYIIIIEYRFIFRFKIDIFFLLFFKIMNVYEIISYFLNSN